MPISGICQVTMPDSVQYNIKITSLELKLYHMTDSKSLFLSVIPQWCSGNTVASLTFRSRVQTGEKLIVAYQKFTVQKLDQMFVLISSAHKTTNHDVAYRVLKARYVDTFYNSKRQNNYHPTTRGS